jgi:hypothetical protein
VARVSSSVITTTGTPQVANLVEKLKLALNLTTIGIEVQNQNIAVTARDDFSDPVHAPLGEYRKLTAQRGRKQHRETGVPEYSRSFIIS